MLTNLGSAEAQPVTEATLCAADDAYCRYIQRIISAVPSKDAAISITKGDFRLRCPSHSRGSGTACGVRCVFWYYDIDHTPDSPVVVDTPVVGHQLTEAALAYSRSYNKVLVTHPDFPDRDVCGIPKNDEDAANYDDYFGHPPRPEDAPKEFKDVATAARFGRLDEVSRLLKEGKSPNDKDKFGLVAIQWAAARGFEQIVDALLTAPNFRMGHFPFGDSPDRLAARFGHLGVFKKVFRWSSYGASTQLAGIISQAALGGSTEVVRYLLDELHGWASTEEALVAAARGHSVLLRFYLDRGIDIEATTAATFDGKRETLLSRAIREGREETVRLLLSRGASTSSETLTFGARWGTRAVLKALLDHGVGISEEPDGGRNLLSTALAHISNRCWREDEKIALLIKNGAEPNAHDEKGRAPLVSAVAFSNIVVDGYSTSMSSKIGPFRDAVPGHLECIRELLDNGADPSLGDDNGDAALHFAARSDYHAPTVELLLTKGADINLRNRAGKTPLDVALEGELERIPKILLAHGAKRASELSDALAAPGGVH